MSDERLVVVETEKIPAALGLFLLGNISDAMLENQWDVQREFRMYAEIACDPKVRAAVRMDAAQRIRTIAKEGAILAGYIRAFEVTSEQDVGTVTMTTKVTGGGFLSNPSDTLAKLQEGLSLHDQQPQLNAGRRSPRLIPGNPESTGGDPNNTLLNGEQDAQSNDESGNPQRGV